MQSESTDTTVSRVIFIEWTPAPLSSMGCHFKERYWENLKDFGLWFNQKLFFKRLSLRPIAPEFLYSYQSSSWSQSVHGLVLLGQMPLVFLFFNKLAPLLSFFFLFHFKKIHQLFSTWLFVFFSSVNNNHGGNLMISYWVWIYFSKKLWKDILIFVFKMIMLAAVRNYRGAGVEARIPRKRLQEFRWKMTVAWTEWKQWTLRGMDVARICFWDLIGLADGLK